MGTQKSRMCRSWALLAALAVATGCSCGGTRARSDGAPAVDGGTDVQYDAVANDRTPQQDAYGDGYGSNPAGWEAPLDVPWGADGTRQLHPIEVPSVGDTIDCGPACKQVTFLPGTRGCTTLGGAFSVDGDYLATEIGYQVNGYDHCLQAYVDLRSLKAYAFGSIMAGATNSACGSSAVRAGRIVYACNGGTDTDLRSEVRLFDIATASELVLWTGIGLAELDQATALVFMGDSAAAMMSPGCVGACNSTVFLLPLAGGDRQQLYPAPPGAGGGLAGLAGSYPTLVTFDMTRYYSTYRVEVVSLDVNQPGVAVDVSLALADQWDPRISGTRVVWVDARNDATGSMYSATNTDIYLKDTATSQERAICTDPAKQKEPDIEGDLVAWMDGRVTAENPDGMWTPYLLNLDGGTEQRIQLNQGYWRDELHINQGRLFFICGHFSPWTSQICMVDLHELGLAK
jgi:hypothetical protein